MLDAMDVMLFSLIVSELMREFSMDTGTAGFLNSLTLAASAIGGFPLRFPGRQNRPHARFNAVHPGLLVFQRRLCIHPHGLATCFVPVRASVWGWEANGAAPQR
jgi:hypothetical protein